MGSFGYTSEQAEAIRVAESGETFVLDAPAGSGKSSTARGMCERINGRVLYLVYNRAARNDAEKSFPKSAVIKTTSQLAWHAYKDDYDKRMDPRAPRVPSWETARIVKIKPVELGEGLVIQPGTIAAMATETIERFCYTAAPQITIGHVPPLPLGFNPAQEEYLRETVCKWAQHIWVSSLDPRSPLRFTMDYAFKLLVMSEPQLGFDTIIVDEAQDSNGATEKLVKDQYAQQVIIGDPGQQLYSWRGATDIMSKFDGPRLQLTQSFRFGEEVANEAARWLDHTETGITIKGLSSLDSSVTDAPMDEPNAILCRTNAGVMTEAIKYLTRGLNVGVVGGTRALSDLAYAANDLMAGRPCKHPELIAFKDWKELMTHSKEPGGGDLKVLVNLINVYGVSDIISACRNMVPEKNADVVVSTGHKCVHPDTIVETPNGLVPIRDIQNNGIIATPEGVKTYRGKFIRPASAILQITTCRGNTLKVTMDHGVTVWRGGEHIRVRADEVQKGDLVRMRLGATIDADSAPVLHNPTSADVREVVHQVPSVVDEDFGEFLGLMVADGTVWAKGFRLVKRNLSVVNRFQDLTEKLFGYRACIQDRKDNAEGAEISSTWITRWLKEIDGILPRKKDVPGVIMRSPMSVQAAFIRGFAEDGTVNMRGSVVDHITLNSSDFHILQKVQVMLLRFGIVSSVRYYHGTGWLYMYSRHAKAFGELIGFVAPQKQSKLANFGEDTRTLIPLNRSELAPMENYMDRFDKQNARARGYVSYRVAQKIIALAPTEVTEVLRDRLNWAYDKVDSLEVIEHGETMCVEVPEGSRFLQNGFDGWNSKGREWNSVQVGFDFESSEPKPFENPLTGEMEPGVISRHDAMLHYVVTTRARKELSRGGLHWIDKYSSKNVEQ